MATLLSTDAAQQVMSAEFVFNWNDDMASTSGTVIDFNDTGARAYDIIELPANSVVVGGEMVEETAYAGPTAFTVTIGDSDTANRYLGTTDIMGTSGRTALVPTGYVNTNGLPIRLTIASLTVAAASAGKIRIRVEYIVRGKASEVTA